MSKRIPMNDDAVERTFGAITAAAILLMAAGLLMLAILPINNYHHANGFVEFREQYRVISQREGSVTGIFAENYSMVREGDTLVQLRSENSELETRALSARKQYLQKEYTVLKSLFRTGAISRPEVERKALEIRETETRLLDYQHNIVCAPVAGRVYYTVLPDYMKGTYVEKGEVIAYIFPSDEKQICIRIPNTFADRFKTGAAVLFRYSDPVSFKVRKMRGFIYKLFINKSEGTVELYCDLADGPGPLALFHPFTRVDAAIVVNSTSIAHDLFGIDVFPPVRNFLNRFAFCRSILRFVNGENPPVSAGKADGSIP